MSDGINWLFSSDTEVGSCKYFVDKDNSVVFVILKTGKAEVLNDTVYSVRHMLFKAESESDSNTVTKKRLTLQKSVPIPFFLNLSQPIKPSFRSQFWQTKIPTMKKRFRPAHTVFSADFWAVSKG